MLEFNDLKCEAFKNDSTSMQVLYMFQDALRMINQQYNNPKSVLSTISTISTKRRVIPQTCEVSPDNFTIRLRIYEIGDVSFPVYWFAAQSAAYRSVRADSRSRINVEYKKCAPSYVEVVYNLWIDLPF